MTLAKTDPKIYRAIQHELNRQRNGLEMIPSENYTSPAVLEAIGSILTNKYSEGYPGKRYYAGNEFVDQIENLAIERAKKLFGFSHANVQPYSGSPANQAVCFALLNPGDKLMGMHLLYGGHLTHGWKINFSGVYYQSVQYTTGKDGWLDYDALEAQVKKEKPKLIFVGATAYPRIIDFKKFSRIAKTNNAYLTADISHIAGLIVAGVHPSPTGLADVVTTTTHKTLRGPRGAIILCNGQPSDPLNPPPVRPHTKFGVGASSKKYLPTLIDRAVFPGLQGGPHNHQTAAIAVCLKEAATKEFKKYGEQIVKNAKALAKALLEYNFSLITGGTDNHLILIDLCSKKITGKQAETALGKAGITVNKNTIPFDSRKPFDPSGIRLGTPALTSRGMKEKEMKIIATWIKQAIDYWRDESQLKKIRQEVEEFTKNFPLYS